MLTMKKLTLMGAAGALWGLSALLLSPMAHGATYSDTGAAVLVWPKVVVDCDKRDTVITITNRPTIPDGGTLLLCERQQPLHEHPGGVRELGRLFRFASGITGYCVAVGSRSTSISSSPRAAGRVERLRGTWELRPACPGGPRAAPMR